MELEAQADGLEIEMRADQMQRRAKISLLRGEIRKRKHFVVMDLARGAEVEEGPHIAYFKRETRNHPFAIGAKRMTRAILVVR